MLVVDFADVGTDTVRRVETSIKATSPFTPASWICSHCHETNTLESLTCQKPHCGQKFRWTGIILDHKGNKVDSGRFPVHWVCSTCYAIHSVLDILLKRASCGCGAPALQAVYDQFGDIFLFWRDDPFVRDLKDPDKVEEAARRLWQAGSTPWLSQMLDTGNGESRLVDAMWRDLAWPSWFKHDHVHSLGTAAK